MSRRQISPATRAYIADVNYLPGLITELHAQYVGHSTFNGAATTY
jgi:hypothetical protein